MSGVIGRILGCLLLVTHQDIEGAYFIIPRTSDLDITEEYSGLAVAVAMAVCL